MDPKTCQCAIRRRSASMRSNTLKGSAINGDLRRAHRVARLTVGGVLMALLARIGVTPDEPDLGDQMYAVTFRGLKVVVVGEGGVGAGENIYARYIRDQLATDDHIWKICSWHKNQQAMQVGDKDDEMGWRVYETCKDLGAIIATAHEHSYHRTRTLTSMKDQTVDGSCADPHKICIAKGSPGKSFVFVS